MEVKNIIIKLETGSDSDNDKHNKHHKYTLDEALQASSKFRDESDCSSLSNSSSDWSVNPTTVTKYNLLFVTHNLPQKQLDDTDRDVSNKYLLFRSYKKQPPEVFYVKRCS